MLLSLKTLRVLAMLVDFPFFVGLYIQVDVIV